MKDVGAFVFEPSFIPLRAGRAAAAGAAGLELRRDVNEKNGTLKRAMGRT